MLRLALIGICLALFAGCNRGYETIQVDGRSRSFLLHVPPNHEATSSLPLLIALHPFTGTGAGMEELTGFSELADEQGFLVVYPNGVRRGWNAGRGDNVDDVAFLNALIDHISARHRVDASRIYLTGASAGGMMSQYMACGSHRIAAIASVMGSLARGVSQACAPPAPVPALFIHGTADPVVPYAGGETPSGPGMTTDFLSAEENAEAWAARNGCSGPPTAEPLPESDGDAKTCVTRYTYDCATGAEVIFYRVEGGGHTWPGRDNPWPEFVVGPASTELDASRTIWTFLREHALPRAG